MAAASRTMSKLGCEMEHPEEFVTAYRAGKIKFR
jgi:hypothetical protein